MHWKLKAALFRFFELVPYGEDLHFWTQRKVTRTWPRPAEDISSLVRAAAQNIADFERHSDLPLGSATFFELGAGRDLVVPIAMRLLGAGKIIATDIGRLASLALVNAAASSAARQIGVNVPQFSSWAALDEFGVAYWAPFDASTEALPAMDAFISNEVLEHIPPTILSKIFRRVAERLPDKGVSIHAVDYGDHYARGSKVSRYNFLQFTEEQWRRFNPGAHYVNRLRHCQVRSLIEEAGFNITDELTYSENLPPGFQPAPQFAHIDPTSLKVLRARICSIKVTQPAPNAA